jgi:tetraacyldisaccharide 4'-kinase
LNPLYAAATATKNLAYDRGWATTARLRMPVVSIGNLSTGGAGKTPLTIRLVELLLAQGYAVDVLSRGYGRVSRATEQVDPAGDADRFGDEPLLIAQRTGAPVFVGAKRLEGGLLAERKLVRGERAIHLLDDGFQHRKLAREADIVVVHRSDFAERLLPGGRLREPLSALRRADFLVIREEDAELESRIRELSVDASLWWMRREVELPAGYRAAMSNAVAFCGIARPEEFFSALAGMGLNLQQRVAFADHHRYTHEDLQRLVKLAVDGKADAFVTTEKDAVKLDPDLIQRLEQAAPMRVLRLSARLLDEESVVRALVERLAGDGDLR